MAFKFLHGHFFRQAETSVELRNRSWGETYRCREREERLREIQTLRKRQETEGHSQRNREGGTEKQRDRAEVGWILAE